MCLHKTLLGQLSFQYDMAPIDHLCDVDGVWEPRNIFATHEESKHVCDGRKNVGTGIQIESNDS